MTAAGKDELLYLLCFAELTWIVECIGQWQRCHQPATPLPGHSYHPPPQKSEQGALSPNPVSHSSAASMSKIQEEVDNWDN